MKSVFKSQQKNRPFWIGIMLGLAAALLLTLGGAAVTALQIHNETVSSESVGFAAGAVQLLSAAAGTSLAGKMVHDKKMVACLLSGLAYYLCLICANMLFFDGVFHGVITGLAVCSVGLGLGILGNMRRKSTPLRKKRRAYSR